ncbi:TPA: hypothetical protein HA318_04410 [Candidatus Micrarchaeota archaeon]|nr:hypothetical protein [Candidatus Micrarchaeota archaeon]
MALSLEYKKHGLKVFSRPDFKRLALKTEPVKNRENRPTHWIVEHEGLTAVPIRSKNGEVVQVLRDPFPQTQPLGYSKEKYVDCVWRNRVVFLARGN